MFLKERKKHCKNCNRRMSYRKFNDLCFDCDDKTSIYVKQEE